MIPLSLADIAKITMGAVPQWLLVDNNGQPAVTFDVYQQDNADSLRLARIVDARVAAFMQTQVDKWAKVIAANHIALIK